MEATSECYNECSANHIHQDSSTLLDLGTLVCGYGVGCSATTVQPNTKCADQILLKCAVCITNGCVPLYMPVSIWRQEIHIIQHYKVILCSMRQCAYGCSIFNCFPAMFEQEAVNKVSVDKSALCVFFLTLKPQLERRVNSGT